MKILGTIAILLITTTASAAPLAGKWSITWTPTYNSCGTKVYKDTSDQLFVNKKSTVYKGKLKGKITKNGGYKFKEVKTSQTEGVAGICIAVRKWSFKPYPKNKIKGTYKGHLNCPGISLNCEIRFKGQGERL